jgi:KUP system potassium uptake protein
VVFELLFRPGSNDKISYLWGRKRRSLPMRSISLTWSVTRCSSCWFSLLRSLSSRAFSIAIAPAVKRKFNRSRVCKGSSVRNFWPRLEIRHTSEALFGQIYMPKVNTLLLIGVLLLVALFRSSSALASAYGIAVTGTMVVTAMLAIIVIWRVWQWPLIAAAALIVPFLFIDLTFLSANLLKVVEGGWVPLALGALVMAVMYTWRRGSRLLFEKTRRSEMPLESLVKSLEKKPPIRVPGTAVFLTSDPVSAPTALLHSLKHYKVLHGKNVILTIETADSPRVDPAERVRMQPVGETFSRVMLRFGFMETPNVPKALVIARKLGWQFDIMSTSFFLSRRALKPAAHSGMPRWQDRLFIGLTRVANDATDYFQIPTGRVVEVGTQVTI